MLPVYLITAYLLIGFVYAKYASGRMEKWSAKLDGKYNDHDELVKFEISVLLLWPLFMWTGYQGARSGRQIVREAERKRKLGQDDEKEE